MQIKIIFIRMVLHLDSLWNRGTRELGNGLFLFDFPFHCEGNTWRWYNQRTWARLPRYWTNKRCHQHSDKRTELHRMNSLSNQFFSWCPIKRFARTGATEERKHIYLIIKHTLNKKWVSAVAKEKKGFKVSGSYVKTRITQINVCGLCDRQNNAFIKRYTSDQTLKIKRNHKLTGWFLNIKFKC